MSDVRAVQANGNVDATIHDIGYRRYEGKLLGAAGSFRALYWQGFRALFGFGRGAKSKLIPAAVLALTLLPSLGMLTAATASKGMIPIMYGTLIAQQLIMYVLFVAAQAPEILSRDQQQRVLPLILTRQLTRDAYAVARFASLSSALFVIVLAPPLLMYIGEIGGAVDPSVAFDRMGHKIWPILAHASITSFVIGALGALLAALTPRRAYATAAIIATFLVTTAIAEGLDDLAGPDSRVAMFMSPVRALMTQAMLLFGETNRAMDLNAPPPISNFVIYLLTLGAISLGLYVWRIRRVRV
jgi:ABC-2 type transport system permease protein